MPFNFLKYHVYGDNWNEAIKYARRKDKENTVTTVRSVGKKNGGNCYAVYGHKKRR